MKQLLIDIKARVASELPDIKYCAIYNSQDIDFDEEKGARIYDFLKPALLIEIDDEQTNLDQLGAGVQIFDPCVIKFHIIDEKFDEMDGTLEQNLTVYDLKQEVFLAFDGWKPNGGSAWVRKYEKRDHNHTNIYKFIQEWVSTYIDQSNKQPSMQKAPPTALETDITIVNEIS